MENEYFNITVAKQRFISNLANFMPVKYSSLKFLFLSVKLDKKFKNYLKLLDYQCKFWVHFQRVDMLTISRHSQIFRVKTDAHLESIFRRNDMNKWVQ